MAELIPNEFTSYNLNEQEQLAGSIFTVTQLQVLHNRLSELAAQKLNLEFDVDSPETFIQQEAFKRGQIEEIRYLIESSTAAVELTSGTVIES